MRLIQVVPDAPYFIWQLYVQMLNFRDYGIEKDAIVLVAINSIPSSQMLEFKKWTNASVFFFEDARVRRGYASSVRPNILKQFFKEFPEIAKEPYFYHDQDIIFISSPRFDMLSDGTCYVSPEPAIEPYDYISSKYCRKFSEGKVFEAMCNVVGVTPEIVEANDQNSGGAQYILCNAGYDFWDKVERDSEDLYKLMNDMSANDQSEGKYHIQVWTADMWAVLWNLFLFKMPVKQSEAIGFVFPWEPPIKPIMHNAGITPSNYEDKKGNRRYFYKSEYNGENMPFGKDFSYVSKQISQYEYIKLINRISNTKKITMKRKILGVLCTTNKINEDLLHTVLANLSAAKAFSQMKGNIDIDIVTVSWKPIEQNPFKGYITPFNNLGHLNYVLQLKQAVLQENADIVCILEHDVIYPYNYFETVYNAWDYTKYGVITENYIGMNQTGYQAVKERHHPYSMMSMAKHYLIGELDRCVNDCIKTIGDWNGAAKYGWCYMEPHDKSVFKILPFTDNFPVIHVNMNQIGGFGTGDQGKNHHFTTHCEVCYEPDSQGKTYRDDWGEYTSVFNFNKILSNAALPESNQG